MRGGPILTLFSSLNIILELMDIVKNMPQGKFRDMISVLRAAKLHLL